MTESPMPIRALRLGAQIAHQQTSKHFRPELERRIAENVREAAE